MSQKFSPVSEKDISSAIVAEFAAQFQEYVESDCIIVGGGSSGLIEPARGFLSSNGITTLGEASGLGVS